MRRAQETTEKLIPRFARNEEVDQTSPSLKTFFVFFSASSALKAKMRGSAISQNLVTQSSE